MEPRAITDADMALWADRNPMATKFTAPGEMEAGIEPCPAVHEVVEVVWCVVHNGVAPAPDIIANPHPTCDMFDGYVDDDCRLVPLYIKEADHG